MWLLYSDIWKTSKPPTTRLAGNAPAQKRYHTRRALSTATFTRAILRRIELIGHRVYHRHRRVAMIERPLNAFKIVKFPHQIDSVHLPDAVRRDILRKPERPSRPLDIRPHSLPRSMLRRTLWTLKNPDFPPAFLIISAAKHFVRFTRLRFPVFCSRIQNCKRGACPVFGASRRRSVVLAGRGVSRRRAPCPCLGRPPCRAVPPLGASVARGKDR